MSANGGKQDGTAGGVMEGGIRQTGVSRAKTFFIIKIKMSDARSFDLASLIFVVVYIPWLTGAHFIISV